MPEHGEGENQAQVFNIKPILEDLNKSSKQILSGFSDELKKFHLEKLSSIPSIQHKVFEPVQKLNEKNFDSKIISQSVLKYCRDLHIWIKSVQYVDQKLFSIEKINSLSEEIRITIESQNETETVIQNDEYWRLEKSDSLRVRFWKNNTKAKLFLKESSLSVKNYIRKKRNREEQFLTPNTRVFNLREFLIFYYDSAFQNLLLKIWIEYLNDAVQKIQKLHLAIESIIDKLQFLDQFQDVYKEENVESVLSICAQLKTEYDELFLDLENFSSLKEVVAASFENFKNDINLSINKKIKFAGTKILPTSKFDLFAKEKLNERLNEQFITASQVWGRYFKGEIDDWSKDLEISILQANCVKNYLAAIAKFEFATNEKIIPSVNEIEAIIVSRLNLLEQTKHTTLTKLRSDVIKANKDVLNVLRDEKIPLAHDTIINVDPLLILNSYLISIKRDIDKLSEIYRIFKAKKVSKGIPQLEFVEIPLKDVVTDEFYLDLRKLFLVFHDNVDAKIQKIIRTISEIDQVVEFNFAAALELLQNKSNEVPLEEIKQTVVDGLIRAKGQVNTLSKSLAEIEILASEKLLDFTLDFAAQLQRLGDNENVIALQVRLAKTKAEERVKEYRRNLIAKVKSAVPLFVNFVKDSYRTAEEKYLKVKSFTGIGKVESDEAQKLAIYISETKDKLNSIPFVYRRLFRFEPLEDIRFFIGRQNESEYIREKWDLWKKGKYAVTALIGDNGTGRTSLLNYCKSQIFSSERIIEITLDTTVSDREKLFKSLIKLHPDKEATTLLELEELILSSDKKVICILENFHNLFLRNVNGFEALEEFLLFIGKTHLKIYWLVTSGIYGWNYLDRVLEVSRSFQYVLHLKNFDSENIRKIILKRHKMSGYTLKYNEPKNITENRKYKKLSNEEEKQNYIENYFFEELTENSSGNLTIAILYWLKSIAEIKNEQITISTAPVPDSSLFQHFTNEELFTFAAFLQHQTLSPEELSFIFNTSIEKSRLILNRLTNRGLLIEMKRGYQIHYVIYLQLIKSLKLKNILN
ncbi:MAG: hypothetical protein K9J12_13620 [Melioribacteraceae bacterium]|nr:hypothetical protein [Melioribacteraceae bacterium]MCF8263909.1 hypothetical protein [Melioribacteraceae bacterium]MCF8430314.1 hypothetical protein [Melioribacteraceae bacterium]